MPLNATQEEQVERAQKELAIKVQLEQALDKDINRVFRRMSADLRNTIATTGGTISAGTYANDINQTLNRHYKRVERTFSKEITMFLRANRLNLRESLISDLTAIGKLRNLTVAQVIRNIERTVKVDLESFRIASTAESTLNITNTNQKELDLAVSKATVELREELGREPTNFELAKASSANFLRRSVPRSRTISSTETQRAAEGTKQIERDALLSFRNSPQATLQLDIDPLLDQEVWVSQGDSLVRDGDGGPFNHLAADGQRKLNGTFTVSNQLLRYPGDRTLGASAGNVINCRCSAITIID